MKIFILVVPLNENEIIDKTIKVLKTNRGGKITYHGPGQLVFYFVINLKKGKRYKKIYITLEATIINTLKSYQIQTFSDKKNIGIWYNDNSQIKKIAAIGIRISKWIAYHGFSINIDNNIKKYESIIPCGIKDRGITNLMEIKSQNYENLEDRLIDNFISNLKNLTS